ncbi:MAG: hypothetical protein H6936_18130 [Burkholderiales bacterium]|nr:hypothetical protein [Calditrichota bacterium]MCB1984048.1 hypothetical protein [Nitrosomonas sp.]MCP5276714.1 hypothetical protein [Burkholderiales bacterium]MCP5303613.1 hypothetical protein [Pseudomonadales bacterium]
MDNKIDELETRMRKTEQVLAGLKIAAGVLGVSAIGIVGFVSWVITKTTEDVEGSRDQAIVSIKETRDEAKVTVEGARDEAVSAVKAEAEKDWGKKLFVEHSTYLDRIDAGPQSIKIGAKSEFDICALSETMVSLTKGGYCKVWIEGDEWRLRAHESACAAVCLSFH